MKIIYYYYELDGPMYQWQYLHFIEELKQHNIFIETFNPNSYANIDAANESLITYMKKNGPYDLFMSCDESSILYRSTVEDVKKIFSIPTILICWDNLELPYKQKEVAKAFDLIWLIASNTEYLFLKWGCKTVFQPAAANPNNFKPNPSGNFIPSVGFIGTPYGGRVNRINFLTNQGVNCNVYSNTLFNSGNQLKHRKIDLIDVSIKFSRYLRFPIGRKVLFTTIKNQFFSAKSRLVENEFLTKAHSVPFEEMCRLYSDLALSLNIIELRDTHISSNPIQFNNLRVFEIPMSGGLELTSYNDELSSYFEDGKEIVLFKSLDEMIDKCKFYLNPPNEKIITKMKLAARLRAEAEHTWFNRFDTVLKQL
jgi:spore maturation protein CgeB